MIEADRHRDEQQTAQRGGGVRRGVTAVLQVLSKKAGPEDDQTEAQRFHDALQECWR